LGIKLDVNELTKDCSIPADWQVDTVIDLP